MSDLNNKITFSGIDNDKLIIGQSVSFTVTLTSDKIISTGSKITIKNHSSNIQFRKDSFNVTNEAGNLKATAELDFKILSGTTAGSEITFNVETNATAGNSTFPSQPFSGTSKAAPIGSKNKMSISINKNADLAIGQHVSFIVTLTSDNPISIGSKINITNNSQNIVQFDSIDSTLNLTNDARTASAQLGFTVLSNVSDSSDIKFTVETTATSNGLPFDSVPFKGKAYEIDINSLALFIEKPFLQTNISDGNQSNYTPIHTILKSTSGKLMAYTPIFITSNTLHKMKDFHFKQADNITDITLEKIGPNEGLMIASDEHGLVKFYLYTKLSEVAILILNTVILDGVADIPAGQVIYAVNYKNPGYMNSIGTPNIAGFTIGNLYSPGLREFATTVDSYDRAADYDIILFFVNSNYTGYSVTLTNHLKQLGQPILLPYSIFKEKESSQFSYSVVKKSGDALYSEILTLNYIGGIPYEPDPEVKRGFDPCIIHSSLGVGPDNILQPGSGNYISYGSIMKYPGYKYDGLFIEIIRSNIIELKEDTQPVPLDIKDVTLKMYVNSDSNSFQKNYSKQITLEEIGSPYNEGANENSIFFHIPYDDIVDIQGNAYILFDYQFYQDQQLEYSAIWNSDIGTAKVPGE